MAIVIDCVGQLCPLPVIALGRHIERVAVGEVVELRADDPAAKVDVAAWCRMRSQELVSAEDGTFLIRRLV
ncbi:MAG TPA: sulfurtransferase TusA family protein [Mycobacteriales bacterium]|nr:sulfurtransferase TusA family protein [Mycobacteriales bacterium]